MCKTTAWQTRKPKRETKHCWITMWSSRKQVRHDDQSWYPPNSWVASLAMDSWMGHCPLLEKNWKLEIKGRPAPPGFSWKMHSTMKSENKKRIIFHYKLFETEFDSHTHTHTHTHTHVCEGSLEAAGVGGGTSEAIEWNRRLVGGVLSASYGPFNLVAIFWKQLVG